MEELNALSALLLDFIQSSSRSWDERVQLRERVQAVLARGADDPMSRQPFAGALAERVTDTSLLFRLLAEIQDFDEVDSASLVVRFPIDVAAAWWRLASPESRGELIASLTPNSHWAVVASALAEADATREDIEALCTASLSFDENEGRQSVANGVAAWAARAPGRAVVILRRWMERAVSPPLDVVSGLVRVAVRSVELPDVERSAIISRLLGSSSPEARVIGMKLECFAWPPSTPAESRHEAVLAHVRSAPRLGLEALQAFNESAGSSPDDALRSMNVAADALREDAGVRADEAIALAVATGVARAFARPQPPDAARHGALIQRLVQHPLGAGDIDFALSLLFDRAPSEVHRLLRELFMRRAPELVGRPVGFRDGFPSVAYKMRDALKPWLIELAQHDSPRLRAVAWSFLAREEKPPTVALLAGIADAQVVLAAHDLADHPTLGEHAPYLLGLLVAAHPRLVKRLLPVALPIMIEYAGRAEQAIALWREPAQRRVLRSAADELASRIAERRSALASVCEIPEVTTLTAAREDWARADNQVMAQAFARSRASSPLASLIANITIVRGASSSFMGGTPTTFSDVRFSAESSRIEFIDPVDAMNRFRAAMTRLFADEAEVVE
jgi:hypothetical protein